MDDWIDVPGNALHVAHRLRLADIQRHDSLDDLFQFCRRRHPATSSPSPNASGDFAHVGNNAVGSAGYLYFSALVASNRGVVIILAIAFIGWFLPSVYQYGAASARPS